MIDHLEVKAELKARASPRGQCGVSVRPPAPCGQSHPHGSLLTAPAPAVYDELRAFGEGCITSNHAHHYLGFAETQWSLFRKEAAPRVKPLLYTYRVLLTGIHLMQTGRIEANLVTLNEEFRLPQIAELVRQKREGCEKGTQKEADLAFHEREYHRLREELERARDCSRLPAEPSTREALDEFLVRVRCG